MFGRCRGSFSITKDLRLFGSTNRQAPTVLDGGGAAGMLFVSERVTVSLTRLAITGGNATVRVGGGIQNGGLLTLNRTTVTGNRAASDGGGIYNYGTLTLNNSRLTSNVAGGGGAGCSPRVWRPSTTRPSPGTRPPSAAASSASTP